MSGRTPHDGRPYYCIRCSLAFWPNVACKLTDCELEAQEPATQRAAEYAEDQALEREIDRG